MQSISASSPAATATLSPGFSLLGSIISPNKVKAASDVPAASSAQKKGALKNAGEKHEKPQELAGSADGGAKSAPSVPNKPPSWKVEGNMLGLEAWGSIVKHGGDSSGFSLCEFYVLSGTVCVVCLRIMHEGLCSQACRRLHGMFLV